MKDILLQRALRTVAVAIAIAAVIDPAVTSNRAVKPVVVVSTLDSVRDASLADRVSKTLNSRFTVSRTDVAGASAAVVVGDHLPAARGDYASPTFAVTPDTAAPSVVIERVDVPAGVPQDARVPVSVRIAVHGAATRSLEVTLRAGASVADRLTRRLGAGDSVLSVPLSWIPTAVGASAMRVSATLTGGGANISAAADAAVTVQDQRWAVLFYDPRPSWTSTFVRRAIDRDPRFVVTSRVVTSRSVSADAGRPPANLDDLAALSLFDAVVIGAPEGLSLADVAGLDAFMRRRGGSVVLLLDQRVAGPYDRLTNVSAWTTKTVQPTALSSTLADSARLRTTEVAWPSALPAGAAVIAGGAQPIVWDAPVGAGQLVVSGALDAWRFRDPSTSGFDTFWRTLVAQAAGAAPPPLAVALSHTIATPGELVDVHAVVRDAALSPSFTPVSDSRTSRATVGASIAAMLAPATAVRLWPNGGVGQFSGTVRAPRAPGIYRIAVTSGGAAADAPLIVASDVQRAAPRARGLLEAWTASRGGRVFTAADIGGLGAALSHAIHSPSRIETWHPMRSVWWMAPFVLALSAEWWLRRRRGLR